MKFEPSKTEAYQMIDLPNFKKPAEKVFTDFLDKEYFCQLLPTRDYFKKIRHVKAI